jgi:imidazolonepropionase-like amidohydrolase
MRAPLMIAAVAAAGAAPVTWPALKRMPLLQGMVRAGADADLVVLDEHPATNAGAFAHVHWTIRAGRITFGPQLTKRGSRQ